MSTAEWIWMPHAAHFICASQCQFRLATYIPASDVIVSTVGEYIREDGKPQPIGMDRLYETMVFKAVPSGDKCGACPYSIQPSIEVDFEPYNTAKEAYAGHLALCRKWESPP